MTKFKKLLALTLSMLLILSALPMTTWAAEEVIQWKAGYTNSSGVIADGYADIPYFVILNTGVEGTIGNIGADYSYYITTGQNNHKLCFEVTPSYTGIYKLEAEVAGTGDYIFGYVGDEELGSVEANTGGFNTFNGLQTVGEVTLEAGVPVTIAFANKSGDGTGSSSIRDCVLTLVEETQGGDDSDISDDTTKEEVIKWKGGYDKGTGGTSNGVLYDGYEDIPYYITKNSYDGAAGTVQELGSDWGSMIELANNNHFCHYDITPSYTGKYKLEIEAASDGGDNVYIYLNGQEVAVHAIEDTGDWNTYNALKEVATLNLTANEKAVISFQNKSTEGTGGVTLRDMVLTFVEETQGGGDDSGTSGDGNTDDDNTDDNIIQEETIKWKAGYTDSNGVIADGYADIPYFIILDGGAEGTIGNIGADYSYYITTGQNNHKLCFEVTPSYTGKYKLEAEVAGTGDYIFGYVGDEELGSVEANTGGFNTFKGLQTVGVVTLEAGVPVTIAFANKSGDGTGSSSIRDCVLTLMQPPTLDAVSVADNDVVEASTDVVTFDYSRELDADKLSEAVVTLKDSSDNELDITLALDESDASELNVILNESLKYDESYTLSYAGITDAAGFVTEEGTVDFSVADAFSDNSASNASVTVDSVVLSDKTFTVTGTAYGSMGQTISGREVCVTVSADNGAESVMLDSVVSGDDGIWTAVYTLPAVSDDNELNGLYTFTASAQFAAETAAGSERFISEGEKQRVLGTLENAATAGAVEAFLSDSANAEVLGIDISELDVFGENKSLFYERLANSSYTNQDGEFDVKVFENVWDISFALESINLSDDDAVTKSYLEDEDFAEAIAFDTAKYELLSEQKDAFIAAVTELDRQESPEDFGAECAELLNEYLLMENDKTAVALTLTNAEVYVGQAAKIDLNLTAEATGISGYTITVTCPDEATAKGVLINTTNSSKTEIKVEGRVVTFTVSEVNTNSAVTKLGTLEYSSDTAASVTLNVAGSVTYDIEGIDAKADITGASSNITVNANTNKKTTGSSSSRVSGGGGGSFTPVVTPSGNTEGSTQVSGAGFTDLADVAWAEDSIMNLYKKGIISEAQDGRFRPNDSVTRAEFVKMLVTALRITDKSAPVSLNDVSEGDWHYSYVSAAVNYGLVLGDEKGNFNPNSPITRQDICVIISRAMDKLGYAQAGEGTELFYDDAQISDYAKNAVYRMRAHEIVNGTGDGSFAPLSDATRAATAKMIEQFMKEANI